MLELCRCPNIYGPDCRCAASALIANRRFFMKYMHAIGQHERLSVGLLLVQMFSQADKLRTGSRGMPGVKKKKDIRNSNLKIEKSNANPPNEYSNNRIFWSSPNHNIKTPKGL